MERRVELSIECFLRGSNSALLFPKRPAVEGVLFLYLLRNLDPKRRIVVPRPPRRPLIMRPYLVKRLLPLLFRPIKPERILPAQVLNVLAAALILFKILFGAAAFLAEFTASFKFFLASLTFAFDIIHIAAIFLQKSLKACHLEN